MNETQVAKMNQQPQKWSNNNQATISNPQKTHMKARYNFQGKTWPLQETHMTLPFFTIIKGKNKIIKI